MAVQQELEEHQSPTIKTDSDERFKHQMSEATFGPHLTTDQKISIEQLIIRYHNEFGLGKYSLGKITKYPVHITLTTGKPYPPILKKNPYPASPRNRAEIEKYIDELVQMVVIRKVSNSEPVEIATPVIIAWHNGKSRLSPPAKITRTRLALNTYTVPDRIPLPRIQHALKNLGKAKYIT
ncbi:hypothetical protein CROQUDRAFT_38880, partial [Cronartium quercuum f. sp. fusiforme G11]